MKKFFAGQQLIPAEHESRVAAIAVIGAGPTFPMTMTWAGTHEKFDSLYHLGVNLEFLLEREFRIKPEPFPVFADAEGRRFRLLVNNLDVVLCVEVPTDFDTSQLELDEGDETGRPLIVEHLDGRVHRALRLLDTHDQRVEALQPHEVEVLTDFVRRGARAPWMDFDEAWLTFVDRQIRGTSAHIATRLQS